MLRTQDKRLFLGQVLGDILQAEPLSPPVPGYTAWFDAAHPDSITVTGAGVSEWQDLSGNAHHLLQTTDANRPPYGGRTINGVACVEFDGTNDVLLCTTLTRSDSTSSTFVVALPDATGPRTLVGGNGANGGNHWRINASGQLETLKEATASLGAQSNASISVGTAFAGCQVLTASDVTHNLDGTTETDGHAQTLTAGIGTRVGTRAAGGEFWDGLIAEMIFYLDALTTDQMNLTMTYLANKWGT